MKIICKYDNGYQLTEGKSYDLVEYIPPSYAGNGFTFPAYVTVTDDKGKIVQCHARRFKTVDGISCDDYFNPDRFFPCLADKSGRILKKLTPEPMTKESAEIYLKNHCKRAWLNCEAIPQPASMPELHD